jgi:Winged helix DNA-binding domain
VSQALVARRCAAQLLSGPPAASAEQVVHRLLAVQGQDPRGARLAIRARSAGLVAADVDRALNDRSLLITWLNRGTLHLVTAEDYWLLQHLTTPPVRPAVSRRLAQEGVPPADADKAVAVIDAALADDGPLTRDQLAERVTEAGVRTPGQAMVQILAEASLRGLIIRGPMRGRQHAFVRVADWLGPPPGRFRPGQLDREAALAELARRFLAGHGPAGDRDLAKWAGLPLRDARRGLGAIAAALRERDDGLAELAGSPADAVLPPPRLLGSYDPLLHGWVSREPVLGANQGVVTVNGLFRPFALAGGKAVATWGLSGGTVRLTPFAPVPPLVAGALDADARDVLRYLG